MKKLIMLMLLGSVLFGKMNQGENKCYVETTGATPTLIYSKGFIKDKEEGTVYKRYKMFIDARNQIVQDFINSSGDVIIRVTSKDNKILLLNEENSEVMDILPLECK